MIYTSKEIKKREREILDNSYSAEKQKNYNENLESNIDEGLAEALRYHHEQRLRSEFNSPIDSL